jgi:hypothetical protein
VDDIRHQVPAAGETVWPAGPAAPGPPPAAFAEPGTAEPPPAPRVIAAEWALWGKEAHETGYHVLQCSRGELSEKDFSETIARYSPGELDELPQYTVSWIPGARRDPEYVAIAIHDHAPADPRSHDGRSRRDAVGREIVFIRLFCLRYAELAEHVLTYRGQAPGYQDLFNAVAGIQLPAGHTAPVPVTLPAEPLPVIGRGLLREQAEQVATMLLTGRQVCVLGAGDVSVVDRLRFIDTVMAMLPYGLRATMSAATSASSTSPDLKLRLFFARAPRAGGRLASGPSRAEDFLVEWRASDKIDLGDEVADLYLTWLADVQGHAQAMLAEQVIPARFAAADIRRMIANLPRDKGIVETLDDLADDLRKPDVDLTAVEDAVKRLRRYLGGGDKPADPADVQREYARRVSRHRLLAPHRRLPPQLRDELYDQLLRVAYGPRLSYAGLCQIEDSAGAVVAHPALGSALARFGAADWLAYILPRQLQPGLRGERGLDAARRERGPGSAAEPLDEVIAQARARVLRPAHGPVALGWALDYLDRHGGADLSALLADRGYLAPACEYIYGDDRESQVGQLKRIMGLAFGYPMNRRDISQVVGDTGYLPTSALGRAVVATTPPRNHAYVHKQVYLAFVRAQVAVPSWAVYRRRRPRWVSRLPWRRGRGDRRAAGLRDDAAERNGPGVPAPAAGPRDRVAFSDSPMVDPKTVLLVIFLVVLAVIFFVIAHLAEHG